MTTMQSRTLSVSIERDWREVYAYAADPSRMGEWAPGLGSDFVRDGDDWVLQDPGGRTIRMHFTPRNDFGVLDHDVHVAGGVVHIAMRVVPNGDGAEVTFLLLRLPGMTELEFERDAASVQKDLDTLKAILEASQPGA